MKTDSATTRIPELDFEIPAFSQKGGAFKIRIFGLFLPSWNLWCKIPGARPSGLCMALAKWALWSLLV